MGDKAGRVTCINNTLLGKAEFDYDPAGYLERATVAGLVQDWVYREGLLTEHRVTHPTTGVGQDVATAITLLAHDDHGRIAAITKNGRVTRYSYDDAGQLTSATTTSATTSSNPADGTIAGADANGGVAEVYAWEYDTAGRLVRETGPDGERTYSYTVAGELETIHHPDGALTRFVFDGLGRRVRQVEADGSSTEYVWDQLGYLGGTVTRDPDDQKLATNGLWVDALGELASIDGVSLWWDTAATTPVLAGVGQDQVLSLPGGITGFGETWLNPGWRGARATNTIDPWASIGVTTLTEPTPGRTGLGGAGVAGSLPEGLRLSATGGLNIAGLDWLGARVYDPSSRGFLSADPLPPVLGAGWDGNPYAYAGNNPLGMVDPTGLRPITDQDLKEFDSHAGSHWEYIVAGAAIVVGVALICTGVGGPAGVALLALSGGLIGGGVSLATQKFDKGTVDWTAVGQEAIVGLIGGAAGGGAALGVTKLAPLITSVAARGGSAVAQTAARTAFSSAGRSVVAAGTQGSATNMANYGILERGEKTPMGYVGNAVIGAGTGVLGGIGTNKLSGLAKVRFPSVPKVAVIENPINFAIDHVVGGSIAGVNQFLRPTNAKKEPDIWSAIYLGSGLGSTGLTSGLHRLG